MYLRLGFSMILLVQLLVMWPAEGSPIDNGVLGASVQCTSDMIAVNFTTHNPFGGRIFVKGLSERPDCVRNYADGGPTSTVPFMAFGFGACNMLRSRRLAPQPGMMQTIIIVISFHKVFVTKVDRAYKIQCFYTESEKIVTSNLEVSMLSTELARDTQAVPSCTYEVRRGSRTGDVVRYANIGDTVFHEWECKSDQVGILVKNCLVDDGQGNKQMMVDEKGCAVDSFILPDLTYETSGTAKAWVEAHVFKYADKATLFFQCTIQLCVTGDPVCNKLTPPSCQQGPTQGTTPTTRTAGSNEQRIRFIRSYFSDDSTLMEVDLTTDSIAVLDLDLDTMGQKRTDSLNSSLQQIRDEIVRARSAEDDVICLSTKKFAFLLAVMICLFASSTFISALFLRRSQSRPVPCSFPTKV